MQEVIDIPENATNGDVLKAAFNIATREHKDVIETTLDGKTMFLREWWESPYRRGNK